MSIIELIKEAGEENVMVQNILQSSPNLNRGKKDGTILFHTDGQKVQALMGEVVGQERQWIAMLVWIPAKRKEKCTYTPESMYDPQYPPDPPDYSPPDIYTDCLYCGEATTNPSGFCCEEHAEGRSIK